MEHIINGGNANSTLEKINSKLNFMNLSYQKLSMQDIFNLIKSLDYNKKRSTLNNV